VSFRLFFQLQEVGGGGVRGWGGPVDHLLPVSFVTFFHKLLSQHLRCERIERKGGDVGD
jgi:hypothetical protein